MQIPHQKEPGTFLDKKEKLQKKKKQRMAPCKNANKLKKKKTDTSKCTWFILDLLVCSPDFLNKPQGCVI